LYCTGLLRLAKTRLRPAHHHFFTSICIASTDSKPFVSKKFPEKNFHPKRFIMKLSDFIKNLQKLESEGHGDKQVFYRHGSSGDCGLLSSAHVTDEIDDQCGPFDINEGDEYISIYAGN
jgi:hypothetical protein